MSIIFRHHRSIIVSPHRGSLDDSMDYAKEFETEEQMKLHIVENYNGSISFEDILIHDIVFDDENIGWKDCKNIVTKRMGDVDYIKLYGAPRLIGICATVYPKNTHEKI